MTHFPEDFDYDQLIPEMTEEESGEDVTDICKVCNGTGESSVYGFTYCTICKGSGMDTGWSKRSTKRITGLNYKAF